MKFEPVIKWSGSKRLLSEEIISYFPKEIDTYYEPFCGSCSILFQLLNSDIKVNKYVCSDVNKELINFLNILKSNPYFIYEEYKKRWTILNSFENQLDKQNYYNSIRKNYNESKDFEDFIFLTRTCVNGLIRYNSKGEFNSPFNLNRKGINPDRFLKILLKWHDVINKNDVTFICQEYNEITPSINDYVFLDPPYINTKGMYFGVIDFDYFWKWLGNLKSNYSLTFDGLRNDTDNTYDVPNNLYSKHIYLNGKISGFKKLHNKNEYLKESFYIK